VLVGAVKYEESSRKGDALLARLIILLEPSRLTTKDWGRGEVIQVGLNYPPIRTLTLKK